MKHVRVITGILIVFGILSVLAACTHGSSSANNNSAQESYEFSENGCPTGKHEFTGPDHANVRQQLCNALLDDALNNYCAAETRHRYFESNCDTSTTTMNPPTTPNNNSLPESHRHDFRIRHRYHLSYHFNENGCDTGKHDFEGADATEVRKRMCHELQDEDSNLNCAQVLRNDHYASNCQDLDGI